MHGVLIAIEGIDGSGKSTLAHSLSKALTASHPTLLTKEPGGTRLGITLRTMLNHSTEPLDQRTEFLLFAADRAQHFAEIVLPALQAGIIVISDRMADSSLAYQGHGRGLDIDFIQSVNDWAMQQRKPDIVIYLDLSVDAAFSRIHARNDTLTSFEKEKKDFWIRVQRGFEEIFRNRTNVIRLNAEESTDDLCAHILNDLKARHLL